MKKLLLLLSLLIIISAQNREMYNILDDFEIKVDLSQTIHHYAKVEILVSNNGKKIWDYVQIQISFSDGIQILKTAKEIEQVLQNKNVPVVTEKSWVFQQVTPQQKLKINLDIICSSPTETTLIYFTCKTKLFAKTKPNYIAVAASTTKHKSILIGIPYFAKYDTQDPVFVNETTTYVLDFNCETIRDVDYLFITSQIDNKMRVVAVKAPTNYWYDQKQKMIIFAPYKIPANIDKIKYEITCEALKAGNALHSFFIRVKEFNRPILLEEPTTIIK